MPVWSENEAPRTSRQSLRPMWMEATGMPDRPRTPQASGWESGTSPLALNVVMTGASTCSAKAAISSPQPRAPLPTMITGRWAADRSSTARANSASGGAISRAATRPRRGLGVGTATPASSWTSSGKMRWATSRSTMACFMARAASSVAFSGRRTVWLHAATGLKAEARSTSWNVPGPMTCDFTWPVRATIGTRSTLASHRPVRRLVAPGPAMVRQAAGRPDTLA
ncbi:MAG: hypothetical protein QOG82_2151 [Actinomycetota bacterium]|nr:hypothetical protein [Actinomycetota bacterium]